jgi:hypothetical protein
MATKFSQIYKQELKSKGILSSLGSAALKQRKERMDIRNVLFGGSGVVSATGQKIFGKGYSASDGASKLSSDSPQQSATVNALSISMERQESLLKVVAKNTMNMNSMARDMNITRQNIASMTKNMTGKSSKGADALWMGADKRNSLLSNKNKSPTNTNKSKEGGNGLGGIFSAIGGGIGGIFSGIGKVISGGAGLVGGVIGGLLSVVGPLGRGVLGAIGAVLSAIPGGFILSTIALAGVAVLIKEIAANVDFSGIHRQILKGLGFDPDSKEKSLTQQLIEQMGFDETTAKNWDKNIKNMFSGSDNIIVNYTKAAFSVLTDVFLNFGKMLTFYTEDMLQFVAHKVSGGLVPDRSFQGIDMRLQQIREEEAYEKNQLSLFEKLYNKGDKNDLGDVGFGPGITKPGRKPERPEDLLNNIVEKRRKLNQIMDTRQELEDAFDTKKTQLLEFKNVQQTLPERFDRELKNIDTQKNSPSKASLLDIIFGGEAGKMGYDASNKGMANDTPGGTPGLSNMKIGEVMKLQNDEKIKAAGAYQIIPSTLAGLMRGDYGKTGLTLNDVFDKRTQDKLAETLVNWRLKRAGTDPIKQQFELAQEFASIANPYTGKSYYRGIGNNKESITTEQIQPILKGMQLSSSSTELNDNTRAAAAGNSSGGGSVNATTNNNVKNSQAVVATRVGMDDKSLQQAMALF